ncbi:hypothetical protein NBH00_08035 [Paraconexibacter antarcticus]|uniref:Uncharacterized protein n=1 Tax=Paraconexibacter antarcticus TaxID=2949664 RepID=A0ABY5DVU9_9ACTN|nr:hypothetical protein [Paraconexibacter antarcticus]UTI66141.1 hypothetical protein NBH00_08035 [Paraconexibacter antarcticus]
MRRAALGCLLLTAPLAALHPRAAICAVVLCTALALVARLEVAIAVCVVLLIGASLGLRIDAAPHSPPPPPPRAGHQR